MSVEIDPHLIAAIGDDPGTIVIEVRTRDTGPAGNGLRRATADLVARGAGWRSAHGLQEVDRNGPTYVGQVVPSGGGLVLPIDGGHTPVALLRTIPDIIARHLEA